MLEKADSTLVNTLHPSPNFGDRLPPKHLQSAKLVAGPVAPSMLIMHYTGMHSCAGAIDWLSRPESGVSCHYVIDVDGEVTQMVAETRRAWHAGAGSWAGNKDINSASIGIEIHNPGHEFGYPDFPEAQMVAVEALSKDIVGRWSIAGRNVLGHSDVAPLRKSDPGEKFDWARLARAGVGYWLEPLALKNNDTGVGYEDFERGCGPDLGSVDFQRKLLRRFGYGIDLGWKFDLEMHKTLLAFQRHFRPARCDGRLDHSTWFALQQLLLKRDRTAGI